MLINGLNTITTWNAYLLDGSLKALIQYPKLKPLLKNDWAEEDGLEIDRTNPVLDKGIVILSYLIDETDIDTFITYLKNNSSLQHYSLELSWGFTLRFMKATKINKEQGKFTLDVHLISNLPQYNIQEPVYSGIDYGWSINTYNFSKFGIIPLDGSLGSLENTYISRKRLIHNSRFTNGVTVLDTSVKKKQEYTVTLKLLMIHTSTTTFKNNWLRFIGQLRRDDGGTGQIIANGNTYDFYYKYSKVVSLEIMNGTIYCEFNVNLIII